MQGASGVCCFDQRCCMTVTLASCVLPSAPKIHCPTKSAMMLRILLLALCAAYITAFLAQVPQHSDLRTIACRAAAAPHSLHRQQHRHDLKRRRTSSHLSTAVADDSSQEGHQQQTYRQLAIAELGSQLRGTSIYIVGMMGTGKSTVAKKLADGLRLYTYLDTDAIIEQLMDAPISEVFAREGEESFRMMESRVLNEVHSYVKMVIATGGGAVKDPKTGLVVNLHMPVPDILARMQKDPKEVSKRPLLQQGNSDDVLQKLHAIFEDRKHMYEQADVSVEIGAEDSVDDVVHSVVKALQAFIDSNPPKWVQWKDSAKASGIDWVN